MSQRNSHTRAARTARLFRALLLIHSAFLFPNAATALDSEAWRNPPTEARPVARWWWPGGAVDEAGIRAALERIHSAGFGAVEVQPLLLGLSEADVAADPRIRSVGTPAFVRAVGRAAHEAAKLGLAFDVTLGSGWPGGLPGRRDVAERQLLMASRDLPTSGGAPIALPSPERPTYVADVQRFLDTMGPFDWQAKLVAVLAVRVTEIDPPAKFDRVEDLTDRIRDGRVEWEARPGHWRMLAFYENRTEHSVLGGAYPGAAHDALTVDHLSARGAEALWSGYVAPLLAMAPRHGVRSLFIDSFELIGELPWTPGFREQFRKRKGYDLTPHLPLLFRTGGESKYSEMVDLFGRNGAPRYLDGGGGERRERIREDYEAVREALFLDEFLGTFARRAKHRGITVRLQAHGGFADYLDAYARADIPESEGLFAGGRADFLKLASSAAHVAGRRISSSESFVTLRFFGHQLDPAELDLLAGRAFAAGINQIVYHGIPYLYTGSDGREWYPFPGGFHRIQAGPLPITTWFRGELWNALPEINARLARLAYALQQGDHVADVAWLRSEGEFPDTPSFEFGRVDPLEGESPGSLAFRRRGLVYDRVSRAQLRDARVEDGTLRIGAARYRALVLDPLAIAEPELAARLVEIANADIPTIAIGTLPSRAPGLLDAEARDIAVKASIDSLRTQVERVSDEEELAAALVELPIAGPLVAADDGILRFATDHRLTRDEHILLVFNESWSTTRQELRLHAGRGDVVRWDPRTGERSVLPSAVAGDGSRTFGLTLAPAESVVLTTGIAETATEDAAPKSSNATSR